MRLADGKEDFMTPIKAFIKRHAVLTYYAVAFTISWGGVVWIFGGPSRIPATPEEIARLFPVAYLITVVGPSLTSILLIGLVDGREGFRALLSRLLRWH